MKSYVLIVIGLLQSLQMAAQPPAFQVEKSGKGTPVIYLPGFACPGRIWKETSASLGKGYASYYITYAGFDGVPPVDTPWYAQVLDGLVAYIQNQNLKKVHLIGHSMGGNLATELAVMLPDRIAKVVLVDAIPCMREVMMPGVKSEQIQYNSPYNKQVLEMSSDAVLKMAAGMAGNMTYDKEKADSITSWMVKADRFVYVYGYTDLLKLDLRPLLPSINAPVLILGAPFPNKEIVEKNYEKQYTGLQQKDIRIAEKSRHFIQFDAFSWMTQSIQQFFAQ